MKSKALYTIHGVSKSTFQCYQFHEQELFPLLTNPSISYDIVNTRIVYQK